MLAKRRNRDFRAWSSGGVDEVVYGIIAPSTLALRSSTLAISRPLLAARDDEGAGMTDRQLRDECVTLFLAGHETTALTLTYAFHLLAHHPEAESRLAAELGDVLGDRLPSAADLPRLSYTGHVVRESMRLYPPAWAIGREVVEPFEVGGYRLAKGTQLLISQWVLHRDPRWFVEPDAFRPERWADDLLRRLPKGAYIPFGDGPRVCIGNHFAMMEAVLILATLAQRHRLSCRPRSGAWARIVGNRPPARAGGTRMAVHARGKTRCPWQNGVGRRTAPCRIA